MTAISRRLTFLIISGIWGVMLLAGACGGIIALRFNGAYDRWTAHLGGFAFPAVTEWFHKYYLVGAPLGIVILIYGLLYLLEPGERRVEHVLWYGAVAIGLAGMWLVWALVAYGGFHGLRPPA